MSPLESQAAGLLIRLMRPEEAETVDAVVAAAYAHDYDAVPGNDEFARRAALRAVDHDVWVAADATSNEVLGAVTVRRPGAVALHEDAASDELDLRLLAVSPTARRRGIARALMAQVEEHARAHGYRAVFLKSAHEMYGAHALYESLGYARVAERDGVWIGGRKIIDVRSYLLAVR